MDGFFKRLLKFEPVQVRAVLTALVTVGLAFGLELAPFADRVDTAWLALFAVVPIIQGWVTRPAVTPNAKVARLKRDPDAPRQPLTGMFE